MKALIFSFQNEGSHEGCTFNELAKLTQPSKEAYAAAHGHDFYCKTQDFAKDKAIGWAKIEIALEKMSQYDWLFYVECDAMIMNQTIRLENIIDDSRDIIIAESKYRHNFQGINTGVMLIKCSEWNRQFFQHLCEKGQYHNGNWFEQGAIIEEVKNDSGVRAHFKLVNNRLFNSYYHKDTPDENFRVGDFVCHAAGISNASREALFTELQNKQVLLPTDKAIRTPFFI